MGLCESSSSHSSQTNKYKNTPAIIHQQLNEIPSNSNVAYQFDFTKIKNNLNKTYNLKFTFSNFKVKYCVSHKEDKNSYYITEIRIGEKTFPLCLNSGQSPNITNKEGDDGYFLEKGFKFDELERTYLFIDIYEYVDTMPSLNMSIKSLPQQLKEKAKYNSFLRINLASFLFKSVNCDFPLMGTQQLSSKTRLTFNCFIEHREKINISVSVLNNPNIQRLVFEYKNEGPVISEKKQTNNNFSLTTPPINMYDLQNSNLFLETIENENYSYISLNEAKDTIIRGIGKKLITYCNLTKLEMHSPCEMNASSLYNSVNNMNQGYVDNNNYYWNNRNNFYQENQNQKVIIFNETETFRNNDIILNLSNLPIFSQINNLVFTEFGNIYNSSVLNIINDDQELHKFRFSKGISSDQFRDKLAKYYDDLVNKNFNNLNDIHNLLSRSIDADRFTFVYPGLPSLSNMIILMMKLGILVINYVFSSTDEYSTMSLLKIINILMKREELDNGVLSYCFSSDINFETMARPLYNQLYFHLVYLYEYLIKNKAPNICEDILIELFSRLYFKKKYLRKVMLSNFCDCDYKFEEFDYDTLIYDDINDEKLNHYLDNNTLDFINKFYINNKNAQNIQKIQNTQNIPNIPNAQNTQNNANNQYIQNMQNPQYFQTSVNMQNDTNLANAVNHQNEPIDQFKLFKRIIAFLKDANVGIYPLDYIFFYDNESIIKLIGNNINSLKLESNNKSQLSTDFYETLMLFSNSYVTISFINNALISATNAHNQYSVYTLYIYFKSLLEYHWSLTETKLLFNYYLFEQASQILINIEDSVSVPRLFWFYYSCHQLLLTDHLKWFIINVVNKYFDKLAFHWSFTIRQVYFKFIIYILYDMIKKKEGKFFNLQKISPFLNGSLKNNTNPYIYQANKDFELIRKEFNAWVSKRNKDPKAEFPIFSLPAPIIWNQPVDNYI